jgi:hypothetical protein
MAQSGAYYIKRFFNIIISKIFDMESNMPLFDPLFDLTCNLYII